MPTYPEVSFSLCDWLNPGFGYSLRIENGLNGETLLFTSVDPGTGRDLLTAADCLRVASAYLAPATGSAS